MKLGLYMATQWPEGADIGQETANLCEQACAAKDNGFKTIMVGQHFLTDPLQMVQVELLIARPGSFGKGKQAGLN